MNSSRGSPTPASRFIMSATVLAGIIGGILGYRFSGESHWPAAFIGFLIVTFFAHGAIGLIAPVACLRAMRRLGNASTVRTSPLMGMAVGTGLYLAFRPTLGAEPLWSAIVGIGVILGLLGLTRMLNIIVYDD